LAGVVAEQAEASVASDRQLILAHINENIGLEEFNSKIRKKLEGAYRRISVESNFVSSSSS